MHKAFPYRHKKKEKICEAIIKFTDYLLQVNQKVFFSSYLPKDYLSFQTYG